MANTQGEKRSYLTVVYGWQRSVVQIEEVLFTEAVVSSVHQDVRPPDRVRLVRSTPVRSVGETWVSL